MARAGLGDVGFELVAQIKQLSDLGDDSMLLIQRWHTKFNSLQVGGADPDIANSRCAERLDLLPRRCRVHDVTHVKRGSPRLGR